MKKFITQIFQDETGSFSSKRLVGIVCSLVLCFSLLYHQFSKDHAVPDATLITSIAALAFGALGLTSADKFFKKEENQ